MSSSNYDEAFRRISKLVNYLFGRADCGPFREPVDWRGLELWDYPKIIKKMMDLGTVKRKLERHQYETPKDCAEDIRLIWDNCKTYNAESSDIYLLAESLSKRFEERYKKIQAEFDTGDEEDKRSGQSRSEKCISLDAKANLGKNILRLSGMELGYLLQVLDLRCPQALEEYDSTFLETSSFDAYDPCHVEINLDVIDARTFNEVDRYVKEKIAAKSNGSISEEMDTSQISSTTMSQSSNKKKERKRSV